MSAASGHATDAGTAFPWEAVLTAALGRMRLSPKDFWAMTPRELFHALGLSRRQADAPGRGALSALMQAFPDEEMDG